MQALRRPSGKTATLAERQALGDIVARRLRDSYTTQPLDRQRFKDSIARLYKLMGKQPPTVVFCDSPPEVGALSALLSIVSRSGATLRTWNELDQLIPEKWWHNLVASLRGQIKLSALRNAPKQVSEAAHNRLSPTRAIPMWSQKLFQSEMVEGPRALLQSAFSSTLSDWDLPVAIEDFRREDITNLALRITWTRLQMLAHLRTETNRDADYSPVIIEAFFRIPRKKNLIAPLVLATDVPTFVKHQVEIMWFAQFHSAWVQPYLAIRDVFGSSHLSRQAIEILSLYEELLSNSFTCMFMDGLCIASEKPTSLSIDDQQRLHNEQGPALAFPGRYSIHSWRGVTIPQSVIDGTEALTVKRIQDERNSATRRALVELYGAARYLQDSGATAVQEDEVGVLYRQDFERDEPLVMVKVVNSSPEPDGTYKDYYIRVPPTITTARAAVAWTFGMEPELYVLAMQT